MGSYKHPRVFLPLDLQIVEMVYDAAWTMITKNEPFRDPSFDEDRKQALRKMVFNLAHEVSLDYDTLLNRVMTVMPEAWVWFAPPSKAQRHKEVPRHLKERRKKPPVSGRG